ncbi:MAG: hypothetical protein A2162_08860 [Deltaproteobacteria bacterium RBG_13_52_11b]|nr:MAG: hypothetical protein A2162_08860 [Deltaproteobacteria bacterium RBG_13_52_11b]
MRYNAKHLMNLCLMAVGVGVVITATKWPFKTAFFPMIVGVFLFFGATADLLLNLFGSEKVTKKQGAVDFQLSEDIDPALATRRTLLAFAWVLGFFLLILFFGFTIAVPLLVFLFLKVQARERWGISLLLTGSSLVFFFGLFVWLLNIPFSEGWIVEGLKGLGTGR